MNFQEMNKTDKILNLILSFVKSNNSEISEDFLCILLGNPSRAQKYKLIRELLMNKEFCPAILIKEKLLIGNFYRLNPLFLELFKTKKKKV